MNNSILSLVGSLGLACALSCSSVQASSITFDDALSNAALFSSFSSYSVDGLTFTNQGSWAAIWSASPNDNGTNSLIFSGFSPTDSLTISRTGGGLFSLASLDLTLSWYDILAADSVSINGSPVVLGQGMQTFALNLNNVSAVTLSGVASNSGYWALDNINYQLSDVPEPASLALFGLGLAGFACLRRRKAN